MLGTADKKINLLRSFSINSRGQPTQGECQTDTGDNSLWLYYHRIFQSTCCLKTWAHSGKEGGNLPLSLCRARKTDIGQVFTQF